MALADLTKQIAQQALMSATSSPEPAAAHVESPGHVILSQISAMQKQLKDEEELLVTFQQGTERIRVLEMHLAPAGVVVLTGPDANRVFTRVVASAASLTLICKTAKVAAGGKPARIALSAFKSKS